MDAGLEEGYDVMLNLHRAKSPVACWHLVEGEDDLFIERLGVIGGSC